MDGKEEECHIFRSPFADTARDIMVPNVSYPTFVFNSLRKNLKFLGDRAAAVDAVRNTSLLYKDIESMAILFASAITKRGFKKGDVLFYVTYNTALLHDLQFGVALCGGAMMGCFQREDADELARQMSEVKTQFILCDPETAALVKKAAGYLRWPVHYFSIDGDVEGASAVEEMTLKDDGSAYNKDITINPEEDVLLIPCTSGSTGAPKGTLHTHHTMMTMQACVGAPIDLERENIEGEVILSVMGNYNISSSLIMQNALMLGNTFISISKFEKESFIHFIDKHKPKVLTLYPYVANVITGFPELEGRDLSFVKRITLSGSVIESSTLEKLSKYFSNASFEVVYGQSETLVISSHTFGFHYKIPRNPANDHLCKLKVLKMNDEVYVSSGPLLPLVEAKVISVETGKALGSCRKGRVLVRSPYVTKGYVNHSIKQGYYSTTDENGWHDTGDLGFIDEDGHVYITERLKMIFEYLTHQVSPSDIEGVIQGHPSVQSVGVIGVPDPETTYKAKAYVVLKKGCCAMEEDIKKHVADRTPFYKHLHGGVQFMDKLPESRGGKLDRAALRKLATQSMKVLSSE